MKLILVLLMTITGLVSFAKDVKKDRKPASPGEFTLIHRSTTTNSGSGEFTSLGQIHLEMMLNCDTSRHFQILENGGAYKTYSVMCVQK